MESHLGYAKNKDVLSQLVNLHCKKVVDAGCGSLTFSKILAELGADVLAIDPDKIQAEKNRHEQLSERIQFNEAGADSIPADDGSMDGIFFSYSLHHVPKEIYTEVFDEVLRVLKPDGFLYVLEPTDCPLNQVMKLFHDEEQVRADAQAAIKQLAEPNFRNSRTVTYFDYRKFESFEDFADNFSNKSFNSLYTEQDVRNERVEEAFLRLGGPDFRFQSPKKVVFLSEKVS